MPLNPNAELWAKALESGEYKQGRLRLRTVDNKFCCLGVACDLAIKAGVPGVSWQHDLFANWEVLEQPYNMCRHTSYLPETVRTWLGLRTFSGILVIDGLQTDLVSLNDDERKSFRRIAKFVRKHADELFTK